MIMGKKLSQLEAELMADEEFKREYENLDEEFSVAAQLIEARMKANLTQDEIAWRMGQPSQWWRGTNPGVRSLV